MMAYIIKRTYKGKEQYLGIFDEELGYFKSSKQPVKVSDLNVALDLANASNAFIKDKTALYYVYEIKETKLGFDGKPYTEPTPKEQVFHRVDIEEDEKE